VLARSSVARQASGRGLVLLPAGAFVVHQLRYWLTYGAQASSQVADQGHTYLGALAPWLVMLAAAGLGGHVVGFARGSRRSRSFVALWGTTSSALLGIYALQEFLEGLLAAGHPGGLAGVFGYGGWWSVPAAIAVGFAVAALLRVAESLVQRVTRSAAPRVRVTPRAPRPAPAPLLRRRPLACSSAGRAPPRISFAG
jgi:hypothetical protein